MNNKIKHLEFIQDIITRMNKNSFQLKGWTITIVSALLALYAGTGNIRFIWIAIAPVIMFWFLDAFYLQQERIFRGIYKDVVGITKEQNRKEIKDFEMPVEEYKEGSYRYIVSA